MFVGALSIHRQHRTKQSKLKLSFERDIRVEFQTQAIVNLTIAKATFKTGFIVAATTTVQIKYWYYNRHSGYQLDAFR